MKRYETTDQADEDIQVIGMYLFERSEAAAEKLIRELYKTFSFLANFPGSGSHKEYLGTEIRSFPVKSYLIFYVEKEWGIEVIRVIHGMRDMPSLFDPPNEIQDQD